MDKISQIYKFTIRDKLREFLEEDIGWGDITSQLIPNKKVKAEIISKSRGIICGVSEALIIFDILGTKVNKFIDDGAEINKGDIIMELSGNLRDIFAGERTVLNIMMRMSSIASSTQKMVKIIKKSGYNLRIAATRKTTPGFRFFEKRAVIIGGGDPHRWRLDDMVLLKDTHLDTTIKKDETLSELIKKAKEVVSFSKKVEVEVENEQHAIEVALAGADIIMFDNMNPQQISTCIVKLKKTLYENKVNIPIFEASGNITADNFIDYAKAGVNIISTSEITMHPPIKIDLSLKIKK